MRASQLHEIKIASLPSRATIDRFSTFQSPINLSSAELRSEYFKNQAVVYKRNKVKDALSCRRYKNVIHLMAPWPKR